VHPPFVGRHQAAIATNEQIPIVGKTGLGQTGREESATFPVPDYSRTAFDHNEANPGRYPGREKAIYAQGTEAETMMLFLCVVLFSRTFRFWCFIT